MQVQMADHQSALVKSIAIPTFIGSLLSFVASTTALLLHLILPPKRHFRHALILNLLIADCINSLNNTISGAVVLSQGHTLNSKAEATPSCIVNAWVGQLSVQAVDFNILIISIIVLLTVFRTHLLSDASQRNTILLCVAAWIPGLITSNIGWGLGAYSHVSGNWCWIRSDRLGLRYGLTHGWRIAIFITTIAIYTCIYIRLKRVFGVLRVGNTWSSFPSSAKQSHNHDGASPQLSDTEGILVSQSYTVGHELRPLPSVVLAGEEGKKNRPSDVSKSGSSSILSSLPKVFHANSRPVQPSVDSNRPKSMAKVPAPPNVRRMLLMNGYPIAYILLWIPGMANRLVESISGSSPRWLTALQASTQFVGFVNAVTYGYSEQMRKDLFSAWNSRRDFFKMRG